jgi:hypothetical protein
MRVFEGEVGWSEKVERGNAKGREKWKDALAIKSKISRDAEGSI